MPCCLRSCNTRATYAQAKFHPSNKNLQWDDDTTEWVMTQQTMYYGSLQPKRPASAPTDRRLQVDIDANLLTPQPARHTAPCTRTELRHSRGVQQLKSALRSAQIRTAGRRQRNERRSGHSLCLLYSSCDP